MYKNYINNRHGLTVESNLSLDIMLYNCCVSIVFVLLISNTHRNWLTASTCALIIDLQFVLIKCKFWQLAARLLWLEDWGVVEIGLKTSCQCSSIYTCFLLNSFNNSSFVPWRETHPQRSYPIIVVKKKLMSSWKWAHIRLKLMV